MFTVAGMTRFYDWAALSLDKTLIHCARLPAATLTTKVDGFGFPTVWDQLVHIIGCEDYWIAKISGAPMAGFEPEAETIPALSKLRAAVDRRTREYLASLSDTQLLDVVEVEVDSEPMQRQLRAMYLHHLLTHMYHHKGQVAAMCRLLGHPMPDTDLIGPDFPKD